jgi:flagellar assembly factor FliW
MPALNTKYFGVLEYADEAAISFPDGLPGFEDETRFLFIEQPTNYPLVFVQSVARADLCFIALPVLVIEPSYRLSMAPGDLAELGLPAEPPPRIGVEVLCLAILSFSEDAPPTANLLAPIVVNLARRVAVQAIQADGIYPLRAPLRAFGGEAGC